MQSVVLEVAIGLALVFYITATLVSGVGEAITRALNVRSKMLWAGLARMLDASSGKPRSLGVGFVFDAFVPSKDSRPLGQPQVQANQAKALESPFADSVSTNLRDLSNAPSVRSLDYVTGKRTKVATLPGRVFAAALLEVAQAKAGGTTVESQLTKLTETYADAPLGQYLQTLGTMAGKEVDAFTDAVGSWFDDQMTRLTATYRKNMRWLLAALGLAVVLLCNVDAITVAHGLTTDARVREVAVGIADQITPQDLSTCPAPTTKTAASGTTSSSGASVNIQCGLDILSNFGSTGIVVPFTSSAWDSWKATWSGKNATAWYGHVVGLAVTTGAVALGGPMWYDFLLALTGRRRNG